MRASVRVPGARARLTGLSPLLPFALATFATLASTAAPPPLESPARNTLRTAGAALRRGSRASTRS